MSDHYQPLNATSGLNYRENTELKLKLFFNLVDFCIESSQPSDIVGGGVIRVRGE